MKTKTILIVSGIGVGLGVAYLLYKKFNKSIKLEEELTDLSTLKQKKSKLTLDEKKELAALKKLSKAFKAEIIIIDHHDIDHEYIASLRKNGLFTL